MKILMTGGTGFIGRDLGIELVRRGHRLVVVSRSASKAALELPFPCEIIEGDLTRGPLQDPRLSDVVACVNLLGESLLDGRWTSEKKKSILQSRVEGTRNLLQSLRLSGNKNLKIFVTTSAAGFYGDRDDEELTENSQAGRGFLSEVCQAWEREAFTILDDLPEIRLAVLRLGIVLGPFGGALEKMRPIFQLGMGAPLGSGRQWMSWIHLYDVVRLFAWAVETEAAEGVFNGVAPNPVRNLEFSRRLSEIFSKNLLPAVPAFALHALLGEASTAVLGSTKAMPEQTLQQGFQFQYPELGAVFKEVYQYFGQGDSVHQTRQYLPAESKKVFSFFSDARNLAVIAPTYLNFKNENVSTAEIQEGTMIDYRLRLHGVPVNWRHLVGKLGSGTLVTDFVHYKAPFGLVGKATVGWRINHDIDEIAKFRREALSIFDFNRS